MKSLISKFYMFGFSIAVMIALGLFFQFKVFNNIISDETKVLTTKSCDLAASEINIRLAGQAQVIEDVAAYVSIEGWKQEELLAYFKNLMKDNSIFYSIYYGSVDNQMINGSGWVPPKSFDLKARPWYIKAEKEKKLVFTEPFVNASKDKLVITVAIPVYSSDNKLIGVVAGDASINDIITSIQNYKIGEKGYSFLIDGKGNILAHPNYKYDLTAKLKNINEVSNGLKELMSQKNKGEIKGSIDGIEGYLSYQSIENTDWMIGSFVPQNEIAKVNFQYLIIFISILTSSLVFFLFLLWLEKKHVMRPISLLDEDVQKINIEENIAYRVPLNEKDPFAILRKSVNATLDKTQGFFEQLEEETKKLKESLDRNAAMVNAIPDLIFVINKEGYYLDCESGNENLLYVEKEMFIGKTMWDVMPKELADQTWEAIHMVLEKGTLQSFEYELDLPQGRKSFELRMVKSREKEVIAISRDITKHIQYQVELVEAKKKAEAANIAKSQFLANMSHEIRTPMNGILGFLELLEFSNLSLEQKESVREAKSASEVLLHLINDILDFSKIEAGKLVMEKINFNLRTAIEDAISLLVPKAAEKSLELHAMIKAGVPEDVIGDPSRLRQILNNLISNAVKFTESGEVSVTVDCLAEENEMALLKFEVKDTGIGIDIEDIHKLFQSFNQGDSSTTRKYGGTGLGLAISKELVKMMDGEISVESTLGQGSTFKFDVRLKIGRRISKQKFEFEKLEDVKILIVDDNENSRKMISADLQGTGLKIFEAKDAADAITTIISNASTKDKIGIAIINYQMPQMNGYELATTLKTLPLAKDIKLILLTDLSRKGAGALAKEHGFLGYLSKPMRREDLIHCIAIVLGLKKEEEENQVVTKHRVKEVINALKPRILLAEDNEINRKIFIKMLKAHDLTCDLALNGAEAVKAVTEKEYDLVFMDCQMPVMDGYESTAKIREIEGGKKHTMIVAMTANAMKGDKEKCIEAGMDDYISKPIDFEKMFKLIEGNGRY